jgi:hypothetical protein
LRNGGNCVDVTLSEELAMRWHLQNASELNILMLIVHEPKHIHHVLMNDKDIAQQLGDIQVIHDLNNEAHSP